MITQRQQDMIDAAKAFLIDFDRALNGTRNPMLNRMVTAAFEMRREILNAEEQLEFESCGHGNCTCNREKVNGNLGPA